jgi:hypothetical protein
MVYAAGSAPGEYRPRVVTTAMDAAESARVPSLRLIAWNCRSGSIPTPEHFLPLLYVVAARQTTDAISFPVEGNRWRLRADVIRADWLTPSVDARSSFCNLAQHISTFHWSFALAQRSLMRCS